MHRSAVLVEYTALHCILGMALPEMLVDFLRAEQCRQTVVYRSPCIVPQALDRIREVHLFIRVPGCAEGDVVQGILRADTLYTERSVKAAAQTF